MNALVIDGTRITPAATILPAAPMPTPNRHNAGLSRHRRCVVNLGPFAFSSAVLALLFGFVAAQGAAGFLRKRGWADASGAIYWVMGFALLLSRAAYVVGWRNVYFPQPLHIFNIRDGGFDLVAGLIGLALMTAVIAWRRGALRKPLALGVCVGLAAWGVASLTAHALQSARAQPLPAITLHDLDGHAVPVAQLTGKPLVINFWATWCGPCRSEMPMLVAAQRAQPQVRFVFADQGDDPAQVADFLRKENLAPSNMLLDVNLDLSTYYNVRAYPTTLFIDADGVLRDTRMGELSAATLADHLRRIAPQVVPVTAPGGA